MRYELSQFDELEDNKWVRAQYCPKLGYTIFNYTEKATFNRHWTPMVRQCRGLILDREGNVIALPWPKFFNLGEPSAPNALGTEATMRATVKHDGALGILYRRPDGVTQWATRGAFYSPQANAANEMWDPTIPVPSRWTVMCEIIHPVTRVVVPYEFEGLIILGARSRKDGREVPFDLVQLWAQENGLRMVEEVDGTVEALADRARDLDTTAEGFVLHWVGTDLRLKVKGDAYRAAHRLIGEGSARRVGDMWYHNRLEILETLPQHVQDSATEIVDQLRGHLNNTRAHANIVLRIGSWDRKSLALHVKEHCPHLMAPVMAMFTGRDFDYRKYAYKVLFKGDPRPVR
jgi:RNA ligase